MKKLVFLLFIFLTNCSAILDLIWNPEASTFDIQVTSPSIGQIKVSFTRSDHYDVRDAGENDFSSYFWGYYIYRNSVGPYDDYTLIGIDYREKLSGVDIYSQPYHSGYVEVHGLSVTDPDTTAGSYTDSCVSGVTYYYRVAVVYRKWDKTNKKWEDKIENKYSSGWGAAICK